MERDFRAYQIQRYIKYIFLIKFLYEYFNYVNYSKSGLDEPVEIEKDSDDNGTLEAYYPMQDTIGSIRGIADNIGKLKEKVSYGVYGGSPVFTYDDTKPEVEAARVISGDVFIRFTEPVDTAAADSSINVLSGATNISGSITYSDNNRVALFNPSSALTQGVTLTVNVTTGLKDVSGNALDAEFSENFTYAGTDLIVYDAGTPNVDRIKQKSGEYFITFDEEIDSSTIANAVEVKYGSDIITGTVTSIDDKSIKFIPDENLLVTRDYEFIIKNNLTDLSGKPLTSFNSEFTFTNLDKVIYEKPDENEHDSSIIGNNTLFQGREYEPETKLYYYRARYFDPQLGRFLQPDPKGYIDSTNLYSSFNQNPVNFSDPMGTKTDFNYYGTKKTYGEALNDLKVGKLLAGRLRRVFEGAANMGLGLLQWAYDIGSYTTFNPMMMQRQKNYSLNFSREGSVLRSEPRDTSFKELAKDITVLPRIGEFLGNFTANVYSGYFDKYVKGTPVGQDAREDVDRGIVPMATIVYGTAKGLKGKSNKIDVVFEDIEFSQWLNKGPENVSVYKGYKSGKDVYVGITSNLSKRQIQHGSRFKIQKISKNQITRNQARAFEQMIKVLNDKYQNIINSISPKHRFYKQALTWAKFFIKDIIE